MVARTREFEAGETLDTAMRFFWKNGYADTSMRGLAEVTGVAHAGLYAEFGGKQQLFLRSLRHYRRTVMDPMFSGLREKGAGRPEIDQFFENLFTVAEQGVFSNGCLMCNMAVEFGVESDAIHDEVKATLDSISKTFRAALTRAKERGNIRADLDPVATADLLLSAFIGAAVMMRADLSPNRAVRAMRVALETLD